MRSVTDLDNAEDYRRGGLRAVTEEAHGNQKAAMADKMNRWEYN